MTPAPAARMERMDALPALDADAVLWSADPADPGDRPLLVLLHGYGADERDLFGLVPYLPTEFVIAAPRAPLTPPFPAPGFSWYPIPDRSSAAGEAGMALHSTDPHHVTDAATGVIDWLGVAAPRARVGLLGFSQGAAVALQAMRLAPERFAFAVNLSGYVAPGDLPGDSALAQRRPPVFWGRGTRDDVIPPLLVEHTAMWLPGHVELSGRVYPGLTHGVSEPELDDVRVFLEKQLHGLDAGN